MDIGFVLDASGSVEEHYKKEKRFVQQLATAFDISKEGSRAGVIQFSDDAELSIPLSAYTDAESFNMAVEKLSYPMYRTRIDLALKMARDELFDPKNGARPDKKKVWVQRSGK